MRTNQTGRISDDTLWQIADASIAAWHAGTTLSCRAARTWAQASRQALESLRPSCDELAREALSIQEQAAETLRRLAERTTRWFGDAARAWLDLPRAAGPRQAVEQLARLYGDSLEQAAALTGEMSRESLSMLEAWTRALGRQADGEQRGGDRGTRARSPNGQARAARAER